MEFLRNSRTKCVLRGSKCTKESICSSIQGASTNVDDLPLLCDGCQTVSCVVRSCSDHGPIWSDRFRIIHGLSTFFRACVVDKIPL